MNDQEYSPMFYFMLLVGIIGIIGFLLVGGVFGAGM